MVAISAVTTDPARIDRAQWVTVETQDGPFRLQVKGYTLGYKTALFHARRDRATELNRTLAPGARQYIGDTLPPVEDDRLVGECLGRHCVEGVDGITHDDGTSVTIDEFRALIADPARGTALLWLTMRACDSVQIGKQDLAQEAEGN